MLNEDLQVTKKEAMDYTPLPENIYQVELLDISSQEKPTYDTRNKPEEEQVIETIMSFQFTLLTGKDGEQDLRGRNVWANFIPTYLYISKKNGKNKLYQIVESLLGRDLTIEEEFDGVDGKFLNSLIGKQCRIGLKHKKKDDKVFENIETYYPAEDEKTPLSEEEKEKARVKKEGEEEADKTMDSFDASKEQVAHDIDEASKEEIKPEDIPL